LIEHKTSPAEARFWLKPSIHPRGLI